MPYTVLCCPGPYRYCTAPARTVQYRHAYQYVLCVRIVHKMLVYRTEMNTNTLRTKGLWLNASLFVRYGSRGDAYICRGG